jgi:hypothetical protein
VSRALVALVVAALAAPGAALAARPTGALLPSPTAPLDTRVPLTARAAVAVLPTRMPPGVQVTNEQEVLVDLAHDGRVVRVRVRQRLTLSGVGDYFFQVPAPVRDVRALPESQGEPGLRQGAVLWQGFSPGERVLAAEIELDPRAAARALPLAVRRDGRRLVLRNTTRVQGVAFAAAARRSVLLPVIRRIRSQAAGGDRVGQPSVLVDGPTSGRRLPVEAPLGVRGTALADGGAVRRFRLLLGGPAPSTAAVAIPAAGDFTLVVTPERRLPELDRVPVDATGGELLQLAQAALLRLARVHQYNTFVSPTAGEGFTPENAEVSAVYRYRTVAATAAPAVAEEGDDGTDAGLLVLLAGASLFLLGGCLVAWAHL